MPRRSSKTSKYCKRRKAFGSPSGYLFIGGGLSNSFRLISFTMPAEAIIASTRVSGINSGNGTGAASAMSTSTRCDVPPAPIVLVAWPEFVPSLDVATTVTVAPSSHWPATKLALYRPVLEAVTLRICWPPPAAVHEMLTAAFAAAAPLKVTVPITSGVVAAAALAPKLNVPTANAMNPSSHRRFVTILSLRLLLRAEYTTKCLVV